jgi:hypothetical protein
VANYTGCDITHGKPGSGALARNDLTRSSA